MLLCTALLWIVSNKTRFLLSKTTSCVGEDWGVYVAFICSGMPRRCESIYTDDWAFVNFHYPVILLPGIYWMLLICVVFRNRFHRRLGSLRLIISKNTLECSVRAFSRWITWPGELTGAKVTD